MRSVADFYQDCISAVGQQPPLDVQLPDAVGCVLAEDVQAPFNLPVADLAACDGYAVAAADLEGARPDAPVVLPVTEEIRAGDIHPAALIRGRAIRIASGAPMPQGADAVLALEFSDHGVAKVSARTQPAVGENIRRKAEDVEEGTVVLRSGTRVGARQVALLAGVGRSRVLVHPRPRVVILSIGDEIVEPGREARPGTVFDANGHALSTAIADAGAQTFRVSAVPDERSVLRETIEDQLVRADLILTTGGISYGSGDTVREVLSALLCVTCRAGRCSIVPAFKLAWTARGIRLEDAANSFECAWWETLTAVIKRKLWGPRPRCCCLHWPNPTLSRLSPKT